MPTFQPQSCVCQIPSFPAGCLFPSPCGQFHVGTHFLPSSCPGLPLQGAQKCAVCPPGSLTAACTVTGSVSSLQLDLDLHGAWEAATEGPETSAGNWDSTGRGWVWTDFQEHSTG